jgi:group II intron reverse transcriptase/maturase
MVFTTLMHHVDVGFLREAYRRTRKSGAPGVDGVTAKEYAENLDENLQALYDRMKSGWYKAPPVKRAWIAKEDGRQRPIGVPTFEDKIVQRAVSMLLGAVYEQDFHDLSYGFREGRSPHQALHAVRELCWKKGINWIIDGDVSGFFDDMDHGHLREMLRQRVRDGGVHRYIGKWLKAGVVNGKALERTEKGTPQGGVISPMLANIFLHHVLDDWYLTEVKPRLRGRSFLIRFADDFVIGCEREEDARRVMTVLPKRFGRFGLTIHPEKTSLIKFSRPPRRDQGGKGGGTFDFLGFTHYWAQSRRGNWVIKRKTVRKRLCRATDALWRWCRDHRHDPVEDQHTQLCSKLRGHYQYYGIRGNYRSLYTVYDRVRAAWHWWLRRRNSKHRMSREKFRRLELRLPLLRPWIAHSI